MKTVLPLAALASLFVPAIAAACPGMTAADCGSCGGSSLTGYVVAVGAGLLVGIGSIALERKIRR